MPVYALEHHLHTIHVHTIVRTNLYGSETELTTLTMQHTAILISQFKHRCIQIRSLGSPQLRSFHIQIHPGHITATCVGHTFSHRLTRSILYCSLHFRSFHGTVQIAVGHKPAIHARIDSYTTYIQSRLSHHKHRPYNTPKVPVVSPSLCHIHLFVGTFLTYSYFQTILLMTKKHTVRHIIGESVESTLVYSPSLTSVDRNLSISHCRLEYQHHLLPGPVCRKIKFILIYTLLVCDALRVRLAIKLHAILIRAESLQFPARRHTYLSPLPGITAPGAIEVPLYHIITTMS